ncbi:hypothetical protein BO82DRAFT_350219 [Aspergillus uvarum CBS 121591]|uniref:Uncharacterized protein n=1 Tax=Aspergillus uvarum CBS 121591 TaxID=1448315 RepID=A0A319CQ23_9EURO|nr:hypothetical protein BO82DRAFT_350219 [Aspergillus uvarum CBS 121591]PYH86519.1 hypothetical protein BO82DRAFT_350219 [Aspergillus uvarum CBS 121591]
MALIRQMTHCVMPQRSWSVYVVEPSGIISVLYWYIQQFMLQRHDWMGYYRLQQHPTHR